MHISKTFIIVNSTNYRPFLDGYTMLFFILNVVEVGACGWFKSLEWLSALFSSTSLMQARVFEDKEPEQFFLIFHTLIVYKVIISLSPFSSC